MLHQSIRDHLLLRQQRVRYLNDCYIAHDVKATVELSNLLLADNSIQSILQHSNHVICYSPLLLSSLLLPIRNVIKHSDVISQYICLRRCFFRRLRLGYTGGSSGLVGPAPPCSGCGCCCCFSSVFWERSSRIKTAAMITTMRMKLGGGGR